MSIIGPKGEAGRDAYDGVPGFTGDRGAAGKLQTHKTRLTHYLFNF